MEVERWQEIERLFERVLEAPASERNDLLDRECANDPALRAQVERLLVADAVTDTFIESPVAADLAAGSFEPKSHPPLPAGTKLGAYRIEREIASGGMGTVFLAVRDDDEYEQTVAIKVIRARTDRMDVLERFRSERQTLARLSHPGIARLLDGGAIPDGTPYLVMEYIDGRPIDEYCDTNRLSVDERLDLFRRVCDAVHFAHRNLVVHRDLKPSNILVDADGNPKLLDFGIAKVLDPHRPANRDAHTMTGARLMTPQYASPEQIRGEAVTTATDVYSLGVVLYRLLTGHRPFAVDTSPHEMARAICEDAPERPSTVIRRSATDGSGATPDTVGRSRRVAPDRLERLLAGDLDTIVLVAMHKDPERRYASVESLSEDLRRYALGKPVAARPDTFGYRTAKFVARHRLGTVLAAALFVAVLAGITGVLSMARVARDAEADAIVQKERADREADAARLEARQSAQVTAFLQNLLASADPRRGDGDVRVREILDDASERIDYESPDDPEAAAQIRTTLGLTYENLGLYDQAKRHFGEALRLRRERYEGDHVYLAGSMNNYAAALHSLGEFDEAETLLDEALAMFERCDDGDAHRSNALSNRARLAVKRGDTKPAIGWYRKAIEVMKEASPDARDRVPAMRGLADALTAHGRTEDLEEAAAVLDEALAIRRESPPFDHPVTAQLLQSLATVQQRRGEIDAALDAAREALRIRRAILDDDHPDIGSSLNSYGLILSRLGRPELAEPALEEALDIHRGSHPHGHPDLAPILNNLAMVRRALGDASGAEELYREALAILESAHGPRHPDRAHAANNLARALLDQGRLEEAEAWFEVALDLRIEHYSENHAATALVLNNLGFLHRRRGDLERAALFLRRALEARRNALPDGDPSLTSSLYMLADVEHDRGNPARAAELLRECLEIQRSMDPQPVDKIAMATRLLQRCEKEAERNAMSDSD